MGVPPYTTTNIGVVLPATPGTGPVIVNGAGTNAPPTPPNGTVFQLFGTQITTRFEMDGVASSQPEVVLRRADGTAAAPTAVQSGEFLGGLYMTGYQGSAYAQPNRVEWIGYATENWTPTAQGTGIAFNVVTKGSTTQAAAFTVISNSGSTGIAMFGTLAVAGIADGAACIQTHEQVMVGSLVLAASTGPQILQGTGAPPGGTVTVSSLYIRNNGSVGAGLYFANAGGTYTALAAV